MLNLGLMTFKKMFNNSIFNMLKDKESFQMEVDSKGEYISYHKVDYNAPYLIFPPLGRIDTMSKVTFIFTKVMFRHGQEFSGYLVYYNDVILFIPYDQISGRTYHWFITNLIYTYDEVYRDKNGNTVYEEDVREQYLKEKDNNFELNYCTYLKYQLDVTKELVKV